MYRVTKVSLTGNLESDLEALKDFLVGKGYLASTLLGNFITLTKGEKYHGTFQYYAESRSISFEGFLDPGRVSNFEENMKTLLC